MKFLALDDEQASLDVLCRALSDAVPEAEIRSFRYVSAALDELLQNGFQPGAGAGSLGHAVRGHWIDPVPAIFIGE